MNLLLDTNILIFIARDRSRLLVNNINSENRKIFVSIVSLGELKSISVQNKWGAKKWEVLNIILEESIIVEVNENLVSTYAEIDSYSQLRNPSYSNYRISTPRNMGKNDLWIASTTSLLGLKLVTTDKDFDHLHQVFFEVDKIDFENFYT